MHKVLARQLRRLGLDLDNPPRDDETWGRLLKRLEQFYIDADRSRYLLERSLEISSQEMTALQQAQQEAAQSRIDQTESRFRNLFMSTPVAVWEEDFTAVYEYLRRLKDSGVKNLDRRLRDNPEELDYLIGLVSIISVNDAAVELFEAPSREALLGTMLPDEIHDKDAAVKQMEAIWRGSDRLDLELKSRTFTGRPITGILYWRVPQLGDTHDLSSVMVSITDITERIEAQERMEQLVRSKDDFLASISHELRTPLTTVYGTTEALLEQWSDMADEEKQELMQLISLESRDLAHLIEDLLVAARADIDKVVAQKIPVSIRREVDTVLAAISIEEDIDLDTSKVGGWVVADPLRFRQIIRNLLTNAVRYGGDQIRVEANDRMDGGYLYVWDNGPGIPSGMHETIFQPYERAHNPDGTAGSVGLGLAISRQLARLMGGELRYNYSAGWSVFSLRLPLHIDLNEAA